VSKLPARSVSSIACSFSRPHARSPWHIPIDAIEFMLGHSGPIDVLLICDGRSRTCHSKLESLLESARHLSEIWVVYTPTPRLGRKVTCGSDNREIALVSLPVARSRGRVHKRPHVHRTGNPAMECSAMHFGGRQSQDRRTRAIVAEGKNSMMQHAASAVSRGQTISRIVLDLDAKAVCDLSPGCGTCARACITRVAEHCSRPQS
jgi:hypothetical protein